MMDYRQQFISSFGPLAQDISQQTGLDPSLVLGQIAHESNWGRTVHDNNVLGITPGGKLASYASVPQAAQAYVDLINRRYQSATSKQGIASQAEALSSSGYGPNNGYGRLIANAAQSVQAAGFKPQSSSSQSSPSEDPALVDQGKQLFQQMTGIAPVDRAPDPQQEASVDVSSDPAVDQGKELFKEMTGIDPDQPDKSAPEVAKNEPAGTEPVQGEQAPTSAVGTIAPAAGQIVSDVAKQAPGVLNNLGAGIAHGVVQAVQPLVTQGINRMQNSQGILGGSAPGVGSVVGAIDRAVPMLGRIDAYYSQPPSPQAEAAYNAQHGNSFAATVGNVAGNVIGTLPATLPIGGIAGPIAEAAGPILGAGVRLGSSAAQGGVAAALTGGNVLQGAALGGALSGAGSISKGISSSLSSGGWVNNMLSSKLGQGAASAITSYLGAKFGGLEAGLAGLGAGPLVSHITQMFGATAGKVFGAAIEKANSSGVLPTAAGMAAGQVTPPLIGGQ